MPQFTIADLAKRIEAEFRGNGDCVITGIAPLNSAQPGQVSFLDNAKYRKYLSQTKASLVILAPKDLQHCHTNVLLTNNPYLGYAKIATLFVPTVKQKQTGIHPSVIIGENCSIAESASMGAFCVIGNDVIIGENSVIGPGCMIGDACILGKENKLYSKVTLYNDVHLGDRNIIHSGVILGADGFGFAQSKQGWYKVPQLGGVRIGNDVEIGSNTTIDRGALENTIIEDGVKLDNQIQIGHNVKIGAHTIVAGCVGIAGSTTIGKRCMIGGAACIVGHITITDDVIITGMTGISKPITEPGIYCSGIQADKREIWKKNALQFNNLGDIAERLRRLELQVEQEKIQETFE